jgi:hypothetical protein
MATVELPAVSAIGSQAFANCTGLSSLKLGPAVPGQPNLNSAAADGIFSHTGSKGTIAIRAPADKQAEYEAAGWKKAAQGASPAGTIQFGMNHKAIDIVFYK